MLVWLLRCPCFFTYVNNPPTSKNFSLNKSPRSSVYTVFCNCFLGDPRRKHSFCARCFIKQVHTRLHLHMLWQEFSLMNLDCLGISPAWGERVESTVSLMRLLSFKCTRFRAHNGEAEIPFLKRKRTNPSS